MRAGLGRFGRSQRGAFLVIMLVLVVVLLGISALILDLGRVLILRSQMQNAADAAALAAAAQLNGEANAQERARIAARHALRHSSGFSRAPDLLIDDTLPDSAFTFFCIIGSRYDPEPADVDIVQFCGHDTLGSGRDSKKILAIADNRTHYVRVELNPEGAAADHFTVNLFFLPILRAIGVADIADTISLRAEALGGRSFFMCNYPPMAICDPFEMTSTQSFRDVMPVGGHVKLEEQGPNTAWNPGNFGFLQMVGPGAAQLSEALADESDLGCTPPVVTTSPGQAVGPAARGINTRFGQYSGPFNNKQSEYPPAPNIAAYPLDTSTLADDRFGAGSGWNCQGYWDERHPGQPYPGGCVANTMTRQAMYEHELDSGLAEQSPYPAGGRDRRRLYVSVLSCNALGLTGGKSTAVVFPPDGFAEFFLIAPNPGPPNAAVLAEYVGWSEEKEADFHVDVQLYE